MTPPTEILDPTAAALVAYARDPSPAAAWAVVLAYRPKIDRFAQRLAGRAGRYAEFGDLAPVGYEAAFRAVPQFDAAGEPPDRLPARFGAFADQRIRGAMIDALRQTNGGLRTPRMTLERLHQVRERCQQAAGRAVGLSELAAIGLDPVGAAALSSHLVKKLLASHAGSTDAPALHGTGDERTPLDLTADRAQPPPDQLVADRDAFDALLAMVPDRRLRLLLRLYYQADQSMKEIGRAMDLSESRVSQMHAEAMRLLRSRLTRQTSPPHDRGPPE